MLCAGFYLLAKQKLLTDLQTGGDRDCGASPPSGHSPCRGAPAEIWGVSLADATWRGDPSGCGGGVCDNMGAMAGRCRPMVALIERLSLLSLLRGSARKKKKEM